MIPALTAEPSYASALNLADDNAGASLMVAYRPTEAHARPAGRARRALPSPAGSGPLARRSSTDPLIAAQAADVLADVLGERRQAAKRPGQRARGVREG